MYHGRNSTFPKFLNFGKVRTTQKLKKLPISEKLFLCSNGETTFAARLAQDRLLVKE